jgi:hypothetical protein
MPPSPERIDLIKWRRGQVIELLGKGKGNSEMAEILKVDHGTIMRDRQYLRAHAEELMIKYVTETVPFELTKQLSSLNTAKYEAWNVIEKAIKDKDTRTLLPYLALFRDISVDIINVVSNNKSLIKTSYELLEGKQQQPEQEEGQQEDELLEQREGEETEEREEKPAF